jgi:hypothetical protein
MRHRSSCRGCGSKCGKAEQLQASREKCRSNSIPRYLKEDRSLDYTTFMIESLRYPR